MTVSAAGYLEFRYSGGQSNPSQIISVGGPMSSRIVSSQQCTLRNGVIFHTTPSSIEFLKHINNLNIVRCSGYPGAVNSLVTTSLIFQPYTKRMWLGQPVPSGSNWAARDESKAEYIDTSGKYLLQDNDLTTGWIIVDIDLNLTPPADISPNTYFLLAYKIETITPNEMWDNISRYESKVGDTEYRCFYIHNSHPTEMVYDLRLYIKDQPASGADTLQMGLDPVGIGDGISSGIATQVLNENLAPGGISFSTPSAASPLSIGNLSPGQCQAFWLKRTVPANLSTDFRYDFSSIGIKAFF